VATAFFFLTFTGGRLILAPFIDRLGFAQTIRWCTGLGAAALLVTLLPSLAFIGFGLSGLAYSVVFPTLLAWGARRHPAIRAQVASLSIAAAGLGGTTLPYLMGLGVERGGPAMLPILLITASVTVLALSFLEPTPA
jgi:fucose permease